MVWTVFLILLPLFVIVGGIWYFNIYFRKQIRKDIEPMPIIDHAYIEAERTRPDDEDLGGSDKLERKRQ